MKNNPFTGRVSLVICTYNRAGFIGEALDSLSKQTLAPEFFEIIIVNNNSTDHTEKICLNFIAQHPQLDIKYVVEKNQGLSYARNRGIRESKYDIITYIDDDAYADPNFVELIYQFFQDHPDTAGIGGKVTPRFETQEPKWMNRYLWGLVSKVDYGDDERKFPPRRYPIGCNMTYRKDLLEAVGGFNTDLKWRMDDKHIFLQVTKLSDAIHYVPGVKVEHTIDDKRISDTGFKDISLKSGASEGIRIKDKGPFTHLLKWLEYLYKLVGSFILLLQFYLKGEPTKGNYILWYRWLMTKSFLTPRKYI